IGIIAGGVLGAIVGGPPGAIAGMAVGGVTVDREQKIRRNGELSQSVAALTVERDSLQSDNRSQKARLADLAQRLGELQALAESRVDAGLLAQGLELEVGFRTDSASLPDGASDALEALAGLLQAAPEMKVHLEGYADPRGTERHNLNLSAARAEAVRDRLVEAGIAPERIRLTAHGAPAALAPEVSADPDGWALQRRVSIRLESGDGQFAAHSH
ncbi:MAG TPA: OmpA family protein, partial [Gammaproteobacteria bacterium]|nr:OmpA family protein [Gammaproteobacteria bacterium]